MSSSHEPIFPVCHTPFTLYTTDALFGAVSAARTRTAACNLRSRVSAAALWPRHPHPEQLPSQLRPWPWRGQQRWLRREWQPLGRCRHWRQCRRMGANPPSRLPLKQPLKLQPQSFKPQILHPTAPHSLVKSSLVLQGELHCVQISHVYYMFTFAS